MPVTFRLPCRPLCRNNESQAFMRPGFVVEMPYSGGLLRRNQTDRLHQIAHPPNVVVPSLLQERTLFLPAAGKHQEWQVFLPLYKHTDRRRFVRTRRVVYNEHSMTKQVSRVE